MLKKKVITMKKLKDKEPILQEIINFLQSSEYMNYFRLKEYAYNKNKHKWITILNESSYVRIAVHQYAENRRRQLELPSPFDYAPSVKACKKAEKAYKERKLKKSISI